MLFIVLLFVAVVLALEGAYHVWASKNSAEAKRVAARLRQLEGASDEAPLRSSGARRRAAGTGSTTASSHGLPKGPSC